MKAKLQFRCLPGFGKFVAGLTSFSSMRSSSTAANNNNIKANGGGLEEVMPLNSLTNGGTKLEPRRDVCAHATSTCRVTFVTAKSTDVKEEKETEQKSCDPSTPDEAETPAEHVTEANNPVVTCSSVSPLLPATEDFLEEDEDYEDAGEVTDDEDEEECEGRPDDKSIV